MQDSITSMEDTSDSMVDKSLPYENRLTSGEDMPGSMEDKSDSGRNESGSGENKSGSILKRDCPKNCEFGPDLFCPSGTFSKGEGHRKKEYPRLKSWSKKRLAVMNNQILCLKYPYVYPPLSEAVRDQSKNILSNYKIKILCKKKWQKKKFRQIFRLKTTPIPN